MKKIYSLLFIIIALAAWNFISIDIKANSSESIAISSGPSITYAADPQFLTKMLNGTNINVSTGKLSNEWFFRLYSFSRGLLNICLFLFLIYVAFRNILNLNIETYAIKKIIPKLIFAAFLGNLLLPIATIMSSILDALQSAVPIFHPPGSWDWISMVGGGLAVTSGGSTILGFLTMFLNFAIGSLLALVPVIMNIFLVGALLMLGLFHSLRPWIVLLAVAFGPVAVGLSALPETEGVFKKWWKILVFWIYYPLLLAVIYYLAKLIPSMAGAVGDGFLSSLIGNLIPMVLKIALFAFAVRAPFTWEKDVSGAIAALPGQVTSGYKKGLAVADYSKKIPRALYERRRGLEAGISTTMMKERSAGKFDNAARDKLQSNEGQAALRQYQISGFRQRLAEDDNARTNMFGANIPIGNISDEQIEEYYDRYQNNALEPNQHDDIEANRFFSENEDEVRNTSEAGLLRTYYTQAEESREKQLSDNLQGSLPYKTLFALEQYGPASLISGWAGAIKESAESDAKEEDKARRRTNWAFKRFASPYARTKSEVERLGSDLSHTEKSSDLEEYKYALVNLLRNIEREIAPANDPDRQAKAFDFMTKLLQKERVNDDNMPGYQRVFAAMRKNWNKNERGERWKAGGQARTFEDNLNLAKPLFDQLQKLLAREARSHVPIETQQALVNRKVVEYILGDNGSPTPPTTPRRPRPQGGGTPPGGASGPTSGGPSGAPNGGRGPSLQDFYSGDGPGADIPEDYGAEVAEGLSGVSQHLREINDSLGGLKTQLRVTTGNPLERIRSLLGAQQSNNLSPEDIDSLNNETEIGLAEIGNILTRKDPSKKAEISKLVQDLEASRGTNAPEILTKVKQEFYPDGNIDKELEDRILGVSAASIKVMGSSHAKDDNQAVLRIAGKLSINQGASVPQIIKSVETFDRHSTDPSSVPPEELKQAKDFIAAQIAGLPNGSEIDRPVIEELKRAISAATIRNPNERNI